LSGRGLCDELITRPEESYRLCCVVVCDLETSRMGGPYIYDISRLRVKGDNMVYKQICVLNNQPLVRNFVNKEHVQVVNTAGDFFTCFQHRSNFLAT